jgi:hypothetical protein
VHRGARRGLGLDAPGGGWRRYYRTPRQLQALRHGGPPILHWHGRQEVNRPFYAIGVLLAFLAVAMMAVGLSSRPSKQPASAASGSGITKPRRGPGSPVFLLAIPDELTSESAAQRIVAGDIESKVTSQPTSQPTYAESCGLDRTTGIVYVPQYVSRGGLKPAVVDIAQATDFAESRLPMDCLSHCDPAYDAAVYGQPTESNLNSGRRDAYPTDSGRRDAYPTDSGDFSYHEDATLTLFRSLLGQQFEARLTPLPRKGPAGRNWRYELSAWGRGVGNQAWRSAERLGLADEWERWSSLAGLASGQAEAVVQLPSWSDYQDWSDSEQGTAAGQDTSAGGVAAISSHSWQQVLQFAVSSLNHAAKTLDLAAEHLQSLESAPASGPVGLRPTEFQPR